MKKKATSILTIIACSIFFFYIHCYESETYANNSKCSSKNTPKTVQTFIEHANNYEIEFVELFYSSKGCTYSNLMKKPMDGPGFEIKSIIESFTSQDFEDMTHELKRFKYPKILNSSAHPKDPNSYDYILGLRAHYDEDKLLSIFFTSRHSFININGQLYHSNPALFATALDFLPFRTRESVYKTYMAQWLLLNRPEQDLLKKK